MSQHGEPERIAIRLARLIAGPECRQWIDALEAEMHHLDRRRTDWAFGGLVAAIKDRAWRERGYALALVLAPTAALATIPIASAVLSLLAELIHPGVLRVMPIIAMTPLPFAMALGALKPRRPALVSGALGFTVYQAIPVIALPLLFAPYVSVRWEAMLSAYALPPSGLAGSLGLWCLGAWAGAKGTLRRGGPTPPSP